MENMFDRARSEILRQLHELADTKLPKKQSKIIRNLIDQFYRTVSYEDIQNRTIEDLFGAISSLYDFIRIRKSDEVKLRVYNPNLTDNAWQSKHTIIEIISKDMPFLVDSLLMEINRLGYTSLVTMHCGGMHVERNEQNELVVVYPYREDQQDQGTIEAPVFLEINYISDEKAIADLQENLMRVLNDVVCAVADWKKMQKTVYESLDTLDNIKTHLDDQQLQELEESKDYLDWIVDKNFILLGVCDYEIKTKGSEKHYVAKPGTDLGILSQTRSCSLAEKLDMMTRDPKLFDDKSTILTLSKTNIKSNIHRPVYMESIGVPIYSKDGTAIGERIILGMYTSIAYNRSFKDIPFLRHKVAQIITLTRFRPRSHAWKVILNILETLPRDDLFQGTVEELLEISLGIYYLQERKRIRLFARRDVNGRFMSCYVYLPRDRFNTKLLKAMQKVLKNEFESIESSFTTHFSDSILARIHFILRLDRTSDVNYDLKDIERKLIEVGRSWDDEVQSCLVDYFGDQQGASVMSRYTNAFPVSYRENFSAVTALYDIRHIEKLCDKHSLELNIYKSLDDLSESIRFKVYQRGDVIAISDALPILENMGLRVISERPYKIRRTDGDTVWINDFTMVYADILEFELQQLKEPFQEAFAKIWFEEVENDGFNKLILRAGLNWREIMMLRAYAKYFRQMGIAFSQSYIEQTLVGHPEIAKQLVQLFKLRFDPTTANNSLAEAEKIQENIKLELNNVESLDDDRIVRYYLNLIGATLRTNFYQLDETGQEKSYLSIKLKSTDIPELPLPRPMFEIFVYSTRFEGVHLRGAKVARGGIRWSDRLEDYRSEILGLMKAQQVKNAVIVPSGAKGGFVAKCLSADSTREETIEEGIACYRNFIRGLLDITDNLKAGKIIAPENVRRYDDDDNYLVVAADKGTATFSDLANSIADQYSFWLDDAFASGGSTGYDHKKMGITARGAWESVKRHFRELGTDIQTQDFTCVAIGDMSGDVFGNGMLLSKHTKLVAAFNHLHILLDPDPDPKKSYRERERLFNLPRSNWTDYNKDIISRGGGVYSRSDKFIEITPEVKERFNIKDSRLEPNKLLSLILKAPVDLIWNGGIGTFVKSDKESHEEVSDRANNAIRIDAKDLQAKVIGEGGNLGFTQTARVEYALNGGKVYTDFIDNSGGVDCSDHEVNIKILLNEVVKNGEMTDKERNKLLEEMTEEVADLVLKNNYRQTQAISLADKNAARNLELHRRYISSLEKSGKLNRSLEFLPDEQVLMERKAAGRGLTRPGIAVLLAYAKITCKEEILTSDVPEDPYLSNILKTAFPERLGKDFCETMYQHSLRREIIATQLSNNMINEMGFTFIYRIYHETGADTALIVRAYMIVREVFNVPHVWESIEALDNKVAADVQLDMMLLYIRLLRRSTRWTLKQHRLHLDIEHEIKTFTPGIKELHSCIPDVLQGATLKQFQRTVEKYQSQGVPLDLAKRVASVRPMFSALDIVDAALQHGVSVSEVAKIYFTIDEGLELNWIRMQVIAQTVDNHWDALTRESLRDDLDWQQKKLTTSILNHKCDAESTEQRIELWIEEYLSLVNRWRDILLDLHNSTSLSFTMLFVAIRELLDLTQTSLQTTGKENQ